MYKYIIIDNEQLSIGILENHLEGNTEYKNIGLFSSPFDALDIIKSGEVDLVFISFSSSSNIIDVIRTVNTEVYPLFIVMSADKMDVFKINSALNVVDFLEIPVTYQRLTQALRKTNYQLKIRKGSIEDKRYTFIKVDKKKVRLDFDEILYVESVKDYIRVYTKDNSYLVYSTLTNFTEGLPGETFMRVHRSYTVSLSKITSIEGHTMEIGNTKIPISKKYLDVIREKLFIDNELK